MTHKCECKAKYDNWTAEISQQVTQQICDSYADNIGVNYVEDSNLPQQSKIIEVLKDLLELMFPGYFKKSQMNKVSAHYAVGDLANHCYNNLSTQIKRSLTYYCRLSECPHEDCASRADGVTVRLLQSIADIREIIKTDLEAAMAGDPAVTSKDEVIISYPGLKAIAIHRIAHVLYKEGIALIPRVMSEHAHHETGIDIHPGATIGEGFFIDHGTGVVIGETAIIGKNVKVYQGVTLGAVSFLKDEDGNVIRGQKRHPSINDNVTIYAGATVLGDVEIGHDSVIGSNVWLMESVKPFSQVTMHKPELNIRTRKKD